MNQIINYKKDTINKLLNYFILIFAFSLPFKSGTTSSISYIMLLLWILEGDFKNKVKYIFSSKVIIFFLIFIAFNFLSLLWTDYPKESLKYIVKYKNYFPIIIIMTSIKKEYIIYAIYSFLIGMFISEIITYGIYLNLWTTQYYNTHNIGIPTAFMSHLAYSAVLALSAIITLQKILSNKFIKYKIVMTLFYISITLNLFISGGRTGLLPFIFVQLVMLIYIYRVNLKKILLFFTFFTIFAFVSYSTIDIFHNRINAALSDISNLKSSNIDYDSSFGQRVGRILIAKEIVKEHPVKGVGAYDSFKYQIDYAKKMSNIYNFNKIINCPKDWSRPTLCHFHNQYIDITVQLGFIGLILFLAIFYHLIKLPIKDKEINILKIIFVLTFLISIISTDLFHQYHYLRIVALFIGIILAQYRIENTVKTTNTSLTSETS